MAPHNHHTSPSSPPVLCVAPLYSGPAYASGRFGNWGSLRLSLFAHVQLAASSNKRHESKPAVGRQGFFFIVVTVVLLPDACKIGHGVDRNVVSSKGVCSRSPSRGDKGGRGRGRGCGRGRATIVCLFPDQHAVIGTECSPSPARPGVAVAAQCLLQLHSKRGRPFACPHKTQRDWRAGSLFCLAVGDRKSVV